MKVGIIICDRYRDCAGGKCFRSVRERTGVFSDYPEDEPLEVVGFTTCGGCPGGNIEYVPEEMINNGAEAIHLATGFVVGYPPCPSVEYFKEFIERQYKIPSSSGRIRSRKNTGCVTVTCRRGPLSKFRKPRWRQRQSAARMTRATR